MFYLYHHHDLSRLADLLTVLRRSEVASPLAADPILVPNIGLARWLRMHLAERDGIAANVQTSLPAPFFWDLIAGSLPGDRPDSSAYRRENLRWHLYAQLPTLAADVPEVRRYLQGEHPELRRWQLAERLAQIFDQYLIYRREMLLGWERGHGDAEPPESWQAPLWRGLVERLGRHHRARLLGELVRRAAADEPLHTEAWPQRLYCFGLGNLPPDYLRLLYAIGQRTDVHFLLHNPSDGYWGDIERSPTALALPEPDAQQPGEASVFAGHPLLASLGYAARDFLRLVYSDEFSGIRELELGEAMAYQPPGEDTLLQRLQSGVIRMEAATSSAGLGEADRSFQVHACHGILREVQVLHDQLLDLLAADPALQPRDIIVMTPNVADFAPAIEAVFGAAEEGTSIPFNVADRPRRGSHPIIMTFDALLDLPLWRWTATELTNLIAVPAVMRRHGFDEADLDELRHWIDSAGIRWGLDAAHREQLGAGRWQQNSWSFGLDRLLAGVVLSDPEALADGVAPMVDIEGRASAAVGKLWLLLEQLRHWRDTLPQPANAAAWQARLTALCADLFQADLQDRDEQAALQAVHDTVAVLSDAADCLGDETLSWEAVREILNGELDVGGARQPFLAGGVTFCGLVPLRTVPFRVVCLLGMNDGEFPRRDHARAINLIRLRPRLGDTSIRDDDRLLLLQWLLSARDVFYLSFTGQDTASGESLAPSTAVAELLDFVAADQFAGQAREQALARLITQQPMQPFSPRYFVGRTGDAPDPDGPDRVFTFRRAWRPAARALFGERGRQPTLVDDSQAPEPDLEQIGLDELKRFLDHPARYYLREVLQLDLDVGPAQAGDEETLILDPLDEHRLRQQLFQTASTQGSLSPLPTELIRAQGLLPPPPLDTEPYRRVTTELNRLLRIWERARPADGYRTIPVDVELASGIRLTGRLGDVCGGGLCRIEPRRIGARHLLSSWIDLLALAAATGSATLEYVALDKEGDIELRAGSVAAAQAAAHLETLTALYRAGQRRPLCFLPGLAARFIELLEGDKGLAPDAALARCNGRLVDEYSPAWEAQDPWFRPLLAAPPHALGERAEDSDFCRLAMAVIAPMQQTLRQQDPGSWVPTGTTP